MHVLFFKVQIEIKRKSANIQNFHTRKKFAKEIRAWIVITPKFNVQRI
jgi:hypothetical protein